MKEGQEVNLLEDEVSRVKFHDKLNYLFSQLVCRCPCVESRQLEPAILIAVFELVERDWGEGMKRKLKKRKKRKKKKTRDHDVEYKNFTLLSYV